jgi:hypothetical protein
VAHLFDRAFPWIAHESLFSLDGLGFADSIDLLLSLLQG